MPNDAKPVAWMYENEEGSKELILNCNSEYAQRLLEFGYAETPLYAHPPATAQALLQEAREVLEPFARDTALAHAGKMETMRIRLPLEVFDAARATLAKLDTFLKGDSNVGRS